MRDIRAALSCMLPVLVLLALAIVPSSGASDLASLRSWNLENPNEIILCGGKEVYILDLSRKENRRPAKVWSWIAAERPDLPESVRGTFGTTDECKPIDGGTKILVTSSGGGVALVDRKSGRPLFYCVVDHAHSADILPGGRVAVAGADEGDGKGNCLAVFDLRVPTKLVWRGELSSGHGVVWDSQRRILWALGANAVKAYRLRDWDSDAPHLTMVGQYELPETGGHDLYPVPNSPMLSVSTWGHCWLFDRDKHTISPHPDLPKLVSVKSISPNPVTGRLAYIKADENWWTNTVRLLRPTGTIERKGDIIYKARWNCRVR